MKEDIRLAALTTTVEIIREAIADIRRASVFYNSHDKAIINRVTIEMLTIVAELENKKRHLQAGFSVHEERDE